MREVTDTFGSTVNVVNKEIFQSKKTFYPNEISNVIIINIAEKMYIN